MRILAALAGLSQENMNGAAGWRFLDMGWRIERGVNTCRFAVTLAHDEATTDDLDLLLDLADSQITYRARYLVGSTWPRRRCATWWCSSLSTPPARSPSRSRSPARGHLEALPALAGGVDGMMEPHTRILRGLATDIETAVAAEVGPDLMLRFQGDLMSLSNAVSDRYFLRGANARPTIKLAGLA